MKIYLIPGLGFDNRIYENFELNNIDFSYLNWIDPEGNEDILNYAKRLSEGIDKNAEKVVLVGHSFGGMIAQEISTFMDIDKVILISSIKSRKELPRHFKIMKPLGIHRLFTKKLTSKTIKYWGKKHEYETPEKQDLVKDMVNKQSNHYLQWALKQVSTWDKPKKEFSVNIFQIHGALDKTFPIKLIDKPDKVIDNTGHFMVFKHSKLISEIILEEIRSLRSFEDKPLKK